jgi:hypothetical protein
MFSKDVQALIMSSDEVKYDFEILKAVEKVNANQKLHLVEKIKAYYYGNLSGKHFALWGLAFKPNTDDFREAPALSIIDALTNAGATVTAYDPEAMPNVKGQIGDKIQYASNQYDALQNAADLIIATEWSESRTPDFERMEKEIKHKIIFDGRNLFDVYKMRELGLKDFAEEVLKLTGNTVKIVYKELPVDDPKQRQPDITKARTILGWEPKVERAEGLQKTYDYFKALPPSEWTKLPKEFTSK